MAKAPEVEHLLTGIRSGDVADFERLVRVMTEPLYQYAVSIVRDPGAGEEVVQNTFIRVFKRRKALDASMSLRGYVYRIATNLARNHLRDRRLRRERETEALDMREHTVPDPQHAAVAREAWQLVDSLPDELATTLQLRYGHGLTLAEVSSALEIPEGTVSTRQRNGLQQLRDRLALTAAAVPGLDQLGAALHAGEAPTVPASPGLLTRVETIVMASVGAKSAINLTILILAAILLLAGGITVAAVAWPSSTPANHIELAADLSSARNTPADSGEPNGPLSNKAPANKVDSTPAPDGPGPVETTAPAGDETVAYTATVRGKVVDSSGGPIAGATVSPHSLTIFEAATHGLLSKEGDVATPTGSATTDAKGEFELKLTGDNPVKADRVYFALAPRADRLVGLRSPLFWVEAGKTLDGITMTLYRGGRVEGRVVRDSDRTTPVPGVPVTLSRTPLTGLFNYFALTEEPFATSDEEGRFVFENLPPGNYSAEVKAEMGETVLTPFAVGGTVALQEGGSATGLLLPYEDARLIFRTEPPVETVTIMCDVEYKSEAFSYTTNHYLTLMAGPDGEFRMKGFHAAVKGVELQIEGFNHVRRDVAGGKDVDLGAIKLSRAAAISGVVVDGAGTPVPGAKVSAEGIGYGLYAHATTGKDGTFVLGYDPGECKVTASLSGFAPTTIQTTIPGDALTITLLPGGSIAGRVTIGGATPTPYQLGATGEGGVSIEAVLLGDAQNPEGADFDGDKNWGGLGPTGEFKVVDLAPGRYALRAVYERSPGYAGPVTVVRDGVAQADIDVPLGGVITGLAIGRDGKPLVQESVYLTTQSFDTMWKYDARKVGTDVNGRYRFEFVTPGSWYVRLESDPELMGTEQLADRAVNVADGETAELNIDLSKVTGPVIRGRVTVNGYGMFKEVVLVTPNVGLSLRTGTIDDEGNFELSGMKPGDYYLWFADSKWGPKLFHRQSVTVAADDVIEINHDFKGSRLAGCVVLADGDEFTDWSNVKVQIKSNVQDDIGMDPVRNMAGFKTSCDEDGSYSWAPLVEGPYKVIVTVPGKPAVEREIDMSRDAQLDLVVGGRAGGLTIKLGELLGADTAGPLPDGGPLSRKVLLAVTDSEGHEMALTDNQRFLGLVAGEQATLESLLPGTYAIEIRGPYTETWQGTADVLEGETGEVKVSLRRAAMLKLKVLNAELSAAQVQKASFEVLDADGARVAIGEDITSALNVGSADAANKVIAVTPLLAGSYTVILKLDGYADCTIEVQVERSGVVEREVSFKK